jgi:N-acetylglutamate synthase-like GNAT family acetyltransferase
MTFYIKILRAMKITDISPENEQHYFCCLEEYSDDLKDAGDHKEKWYRHMKDKGVRVKFAEDDNGIIGGMIQYVPIEYSIVQGKDLYVVLCIWVHPHKMGRGDYRKRGMGIALLKTAEEDSMALGAKGLVTWGLVIPVFMQSSWFKRKGYKVVDKNGIMRLLWKPFTEDAVPPKFLRPKKLPGKGKEKVNVTVFRNGWCPVGSIAYERVMRASREFEGKVEVTEFHTINREIVDEWGIVEGIYIDGRELRTGPPPSYIKIMKKIEKRVRKLNRLNK